jgi:hypothetical protein
VSRLSLLVVTTVVLVAAGCSSGPSSPSVSPSPGSEPIPSATSPSAAPSAAPCPDGAYLVTELEGRGQASSVGHGTGGNITADFRAGTFTIASDGSGPMKLDLGPSNAELRLNGEITSTYTGDASALRLTATGAKGDASVKVFGGTRRYAASDLADQLIGKTATAQVTCDDAAGTAVVVLPNVSLTLTRRG